MRVWQMAGLCSDSVRQATIVNWMLLGVYFTRELLFKMKKAKSPLCLACSNETNETLNHLLLHCTHYNKVRKKYIPKYIQQNSQLSEILDNEEMSIQSILDPLSSNLPECVRMGWVSPKEVYSISRQFCYNIHNMREKSVQRS